MSTSQVPQLNPSTAFHLFVLAQPEAETKDRRCQQLFKKKEKKTRRGFLQSWAINLSSSEPLQHLSSKSFRNLSSQSAVLFCFICKGTNLPYFLDRSSVNIYIERETDRQTETERERQRQTQTQTVRQRQRQTQTQTQTERQSYSASSVKAPTYHTFSTGAQSRYIYIYIQRERERGEIEIVLLCFICKGTNLPYFIYKITASI